MLGADVMHGLLAWLDRRRSSSEFGAALLLLGAVLASAGCAVAAAGGVTVGLGSAAVLTSTCYDRVSLRLIDAASGHQLCDGSVRAVDADGSELEFSPCFHAAVPRGNWTISAQHPGYTTATTRLIVPVGSHCDPAVQSIDLTIAPVGYQPATPVATSLPQAPAASPAVPAAVPAVPASSAPAVTSTAATATPTATPPAPTPPAAAPTGPPPSPVAPTMPAPAPTRSPSAAPAPPPPPTRAFPIPPTP